MLLTPVLSSSPTHSPVNIPGAHNLPFPYQHRESLRSVSTEGVDVSTLALAEWVDDWDDCDLSEDKGRIGSRVVFVMAEIDDQICLQ